jgi:RND family efflux transporter MFP subunit
MKRTIGWSGIGFLLIGALGSCGGGNKDAAPAQQKAPPVPVITTKVTKAIAVYYDQYPATIVPLNEVQVRPQVTGYITGIYFQDGQHVSKGQKLYSIDQQQYRATYDQSVASLNVAKANLARAQQDADRYEELQKKDAVARQIVDHAQADLQASKMQLEAAKANVSSVETNLRYATIFSPLDGTIGISQVKMGAAVSPGQTILNTISSDDPMAVDFAADQKDIARFVLLQKQGKAADDSTFSLLLPDQSIYSSPGHISLIDRSVDPQTGTIKVRVVFANKKGLLRAGMSVNVRVKNNSAGPSLLIPAKAIVEQMGEYFVFVVGDSSKVAQRKITRGAFINDKVIVKDGLQDGDQVVIEGVQKLRDGAVVQPAQQGGTGNKPDSTGKK